jgi:hypothetical protein
VYPTNSNAAFPAVGFAATMTVLLSPDRLYPKYIPAGPVMLAPFVAGGPDVPTYPDATTLVAETACRELAPEILNELPDIDPPEKLLWQVTAPVHVKFDVMFPTFKSVNVAPPAFTVVDVRFP